MNFETIDDVQKALRDKNYIAERGLVTSIYLMLRLGKPLFLEGEAGVGKTEIGKTLAALFDSELIRLQCYEGLDVSSAMYEWNYAGQMMRLRLLEASHAGRNEMQAELFSREFLLARPLLRALESSMDGKPPVLLIDELDRADEEFEAYLLELLSDFQITIPEIGTIRAERPPMVVLTSNRTREIHDALKRRCLYYWIKYPDFQKELQIVRAKAPDVEPMLAKQITAFVQEMRSMDLFKAPGVAETLDWTAALVALDQTALSIDVVSDTIGVILKYQDDIETMTDDTLKVVLDRAQLMAEAKQ